MLSQLAWPPKKWRQSKNSVTQKMASLKKWRHSKNGRGGKSRTRNRWFWKPVLYQLSYTPVSAPSHWASTKITKSAAGRPSLWRYTLCHRPCSDSTNLGRFKTTRQSWSQLPNRPSGHLHESQTARRRPSQSACAIPPSPARCRRAYTFRRRSS